MINQCCIEFFTTSKKAYQAALLSKELATAHIVKACDGYQQSTLDDGRVAQCQKRIWSFQCTDKMDDKSSFPCYCYFRILGSFKDVELSMVAVTAASSYSTSEGFSVDISDLVSFTAVHWVCENI